MVEETELITGVHAGISKAKIIREGARLGQVMRPSSSLQCTKIMSIAQKHGRCCLAQARAKNGASGNTRRKGLGQKLPRLKWIQMALAEQNTDCISLFQLFCMKASPAQVKVHDVFTANADLLFSHE